MQLYIVWGKLPVRNALRQNDRIIYKLKRRFGVPITLSYFTSISNNYRTGKIVTQRTEIYIHKAVVMPLDEGREETAPRSFNFDFGGEIDKTKVRVYIDKNDIDILEITPDMRVTIEGEDFGVSADSLSKDKTGYVLTCYRISNQSTDPAYFIRNEDNSRLLNEDGTFLEI